MNPLRRQFINGENGETLRIYVSRPAGEPAPVMDMLVHAFEAGHRIEAFGYWWLVSGWELNPKEPVSFTLIFDGPRTPP